jgi:hypothetical protein
MTPRFFTFVGGAGGDWRVRSQQSLIGPRLADVGAVQVVAGNARAPAAGWALRGITSNDRYVERSEKRDLAARQEGLGRADATCAALIPIRKSSTWWLLTQDERRRIFETESKHLRIGMHYLPAIARRLHHCRDLGEPEPFDFLTWFEYRPEDEPAFEALLSELRASEEWRYVEHEVDLRLARDG